MLRKRWYAAALAAVLAAAMSVPALAADDREKIDDVKLRFSYSQEPASGEDIGDISVTAESAGYTVENAEYTNAEEKDVWTVGDVPEVKVELYAEDGYRFSYTSSSHFSVSGGGADFKRARIYDDGDYIEVYVELDRIGGKLEGASGLDWNDTTATWDEIEGAKSYEVRLLRDDKTVTTVETTGTSYNFGGYFNEEGDYTFRVRAIASYNNRAGDWSDDSDTLYIDEDEVGRYGGSGRWVQDTRGWWYAYDTGGYPTNGWMQIGGLWYLFDNSGYMLTGWQRKDGDWYYMNPSGAMLTGWQAINGAWYYLNPSGVMQTGWQAINGAWYYMNSSGVMLTGWQNLGGQWYYLGTNGAMYANTWTPDGYYVNGSGVWVQ